MKRIHDFLVSVAFWIGFVVVPSVLGLLFFAFLAVVITKDTFAAAALRVRNWLRQLRGEKEYSFLDLRE